MKKISVKRFFPTFLYLIVSFTLIVGILVFSSFASIKDNSYILFIAIAATMTLVDFLSAVSCIYYREETNLLCNSMTLLGKRIFLKRLLSFFVANLTYIAVFALIIKVALSVRNNIFAANTLFFGFSILILYIRSEVFIRLYEFLCYGNFNLNLRMLLLHKRGIVILFKVLLIYFVSILSFATLIKIFSTAPIFCSFLSGCSVLWILFINLYHSLNIIRLCKTEIDC